jgi:hypothetical protein
MGGSIHADQNPAANADTNNATNFATPAEEKSISNENGTTVVDEVIEKSETIEDVNILPESLVSDKSGQEQFKDKRVSMINPKNNFQNAPIIPENRQESKVENKK